MLEKSNLPINLNAPMDTKVDEKLTNQEIFILHQNARFRKIGSIIKRNGYGKITIPSGDITTYALNTRRILTEDNNVLLFPEAGARVAYAYRASNNSFNFTNIRVPCEMKGRIVASDIAGLWAIDSDYMDGFRIMSYCTFTSSATNISLYLDLTDESTGAKKTILVDNTSRRNSVVRFFRNALNEIRICVAYDDSSTGNTGRARVYDLNLNLLNNRTFAITQTTRTFTAEVYGNSVVVAVKANAANQFRFCIVPELAALTEYTFTTAANIKTLSTADIRISGTTCYCMYITDSVTAASRFFSINLTSGATVDTDRILVNPAVDLTHSTFDLISSDVIGFFASTGYTAAPYPPETYYSTHTISTSTTAVGIQQEDITVISRCRRLNLNTATEQTLVAVATDSAMRVYTNNTPTNIGTMYLVGVDLRVNTSLDVLAAYNAQTVPLNSVEPLCVNLNTYFTSTGVLSCGSSRTTSIYDGSLFEIASAYIADFNFSSLFYQKNYTTKFAKNMYISSGYLLEYDGLTLAKSGFFNSPSIIFPLTIVAGAGIPAGTYNFRIVFEYVDSKGQTYQSAPSDSFQVVLGGAVGALILNYIRPFKVRAGSNVAAYMTTNGGSIFYRMGFSPILAGFSLQVNSVPTQTEQVLYTTGGVLPNDPAPPMSFICTHQERLYGIVADFENEIAYTKRSALGAGAEFSDFQRIYLAASGVKSKNELTGLASMNEKLIIFRRSSIYYILGDGPNILGEQNNFTEPELIANDIGCIQPKSIVSSPKGVFFKSEKGIYLLDPSLNASYIGSPVEQYNSEEVIGHLIDEEENLVQFLTTQRIISYDYVLERWNIDTVQALDIGVYNKKNALVQSNNTFLIEDSSYKDFAAGVEQGITLLVETGWIKASGIQDFGRFVNALIVGKYKSAHTLRVDVYYDYNTNVVTSFDLTHNPAQQVYQFRVHLKQQKAQAIKFKIYDIPSNFGESCELTNLTLQLGVKKGVYKTQKTRNY